METLMKKCACCDRSYGKDDLAYFLDHHADLPVETQWLLTCRMYGIETANVMFP